MGLSMSDARLVSSVLRWQDLPARIDPESVVAVVDVLRWSTVVITALAHGAECVEAFASPEEALRRAEELGRADVVLGGERGNVALPGFDVGNSPREYDAGRVEGKVVLSTTTNGTQALLAVQKAHLVIVASFLNLETVVDVLGAELLDGRPVMLVAAGQAGAEALEDTACVGAIAERLMDYAPVDERSERAIELWANHDRRPDRVITASPHAASLRATGHEADLTTCAALSTLEVLPVADGRILFQG